MKIELAAFLLLPTHFEEARVVVQMSKLLSCRWSVMRVGTIKWFFHVDAKHF